MGHCCTTTWRSSYQQHITGNGVCITAQLHGDIIFVYCIPMQNRYSLFARRTMKATITTCLPDGFERIGFNNCNGYVPDVFVVGATPSCCLAHHHPMVEILSSRLALSNCLLTTIQIFSYV